MKKLISILLVLALVLSMTACKKEEPKPVNEPVQTEDVQHAEAPVPDEGPEFEPYIQPDEDISKITEITCVQHARAFVGKAMHERSVSMEELILMMFSTAGSEEEMSDEEIAQLTFRLEDKTYCLYTDGSTGEMYVIANSESDKEEAADPKSFAEMSDKEFTLFATGEMNGVEDEDVATEIGKIYRFKDKIIAEMTSKIDMAEEGDEPNVIEDKGYFAVAWEGEEAITGIFLTPNEDDQDLMLLLARGVEVNMSNEGMPDEERPEGLIDIAD